jgi:hypothetical protein
MGVESFGHFIVAKTSVWTFSFFPSNAPVDDKINILQKKIKLKETF